MHELSLCGAIVDAVTKHADGAPVSRVSLRVGRLRQVQPDSLDFYWDFVSEGTLCEGAELEQVLVPALVRCSACKHEWEMDYPIFLCPSCDAMSVEVVTGEEFDIEEIVLRSKEDA
jgi:hydrogenase nickel incorporation protein HypA/HybF